jgi:dienelactone hydrolase
MNQRTRQILVTAFASILLASGLYAAPPAIGSLVGEWSGILEAGGVKLRLLLVLGLDDKGAISGKIVSLDQGNAELPISVGKYSGGKLSLDFPAARATWEGMPGDEGTRLEGTWSQGGGKLPLGFGRGRLEAVAPRRPQTPLSPFPWKAEEVSIANESPEGLASGVVLAGTLAIPPGAGPFPAILLVTGSGQQDRDETILFHKPFLIIADRLARKGIAVLRLDDRGVGASKGAFEAATSADFAGDARAALAWLRKRGDIDPDRIGLLGHSEGGLIAWMVAARDPRLACVVSMAGPGTSGGEILYEQVGLVARAEGASPAQAAMAQVQQKRLIEIAAGPLDRQAALKEMEAAAKKLLGAEAAEQARPQLEGLLSPWMRFFLSYDPRSDIARVRAPILALNGALDSQVPAEPNLAAIAAAARGGGNERVETRLLPGLNHLMQTAKTGGPSEYGNIEESLAPSFLAAIEDWIPRALAKN